MTLTLAALPVADAARGVVRLARGDMTAAGLQSGQTVRLEASRGSHARVVPGNVASGTIELDAITANNCGAEPNTAIRLAAADLPLLDCVLIRCDTQRQFRPEDLQDAFFDMALGDGDTVPLPRHGADAPLATVVEATPNGVGLVGAATQFVLEARPDATPGYEEIGGLEEQIRQVHEMISAPLTRPELFRKLGVTAPRGVLFSGPPGSGKTLLARTVAARTKAAFFQIDGPEILSKHYGESEAALRKVFQAASASEPAIIFIDELDSLAPRRAGLSDEKQVERRIVAQLLTLMDGLSDRGRVVVMAATNLPGAVDPALRRPGRFDREITFAPPPPNDRAKILHVHLAKAPLAADVDLERIATRANGYVGADLAALAREAAMAALARSIADAGGEAKVDARTLSVTQADLETGLARTTPSLLRAHASATKPARWDEIGGLNAAKNTLREAIEWPMNHRAAMAALRLRPPRGILLTGPPGSGKTLLARAVAAETQANMIAVRPPDLISHFLGDAERAVADVFATARMTTPSILFFDEFDALAPRRGSGDAVFDRIVAQFLVEIDGSDPSEGVTVLAATNRAAAIDPALLRPGRFDRIVDVPLPRRADRRAILDVHFAGRAHEADIDLDALADTTRNASGAELAALAETAAWHALSRAVHSGGDARISPEDVDASVAVMAARHNSQASDFISKNGAT